MPHSQDKQEMAELEVKDEGYDVFLSYASEDIKVAQEVVLALERVGLTVWWDRKDLKSGDKYKEIIRAQIEGCAVFVALLSKAVDTIEDRFVRGEWECAAERDRKFPSERNFVFPYLIGGAHTDDCGFIDALRDNLHVSKVKWSGSEPIPAGDDDIATIQNTVAAYRRVARLKNLVPRSSTILVPIKDTAGGSLRINYLLRWGLNRQAGRVVFRLADTYDLVTGLRDFEKKLFALPGVAGRFLIRQWKSLSIIPDLPEDPIEALKALFASIGAAPEPAQMILNDAAVLGLVIDGAKALFRDPGDGRIRLDALQKRLGRWQPMIVIVFPQGGNIGQRLVRKSPQPDGLPDECVAGREIAGRRPGGTPLVNGTPSLPRVRRAVLRAISSESVQVEEWLENMPEEAQGRLVADGSFTGWEGANALFEEALCAAVRRARSDAPLIRPELRAAWLRFAPYDLRSAAQAALSEGGLESKAAFWRQPPTDRALAALAKCAPDADFPLGDLPATLWARRGFWAFVETLPASDALLHRLIALPAGARSTFGLCSPPEWKKLTSGHRLGDELAALRGHSQAA